MDGAILVRLHHACFHCSGGSGHMVTFTCLTHRIGLAKPGLAPIDVYNGRLDWIRVLCSCIGKHAGKQTRVDMSCSTAYTVESESSIGVAWKTWSGFSKKLDRIRFF